MAHLDGKLDGKSIKVVCSGLEYPEGPISCLDGSIILVEIKGQRMTLVAPDGSCSTLASLPGGPNGAAIDLDGNVIVCNNGGFEWMPVPLPGQELWVGTNQAASYTSGSLLSVTPATGDITTLFTECADRSTSDTPWSPPFKLSSPDDLVIDATGGIWFSDWGQSQDRSRAVTGIYYVSPDKTSIKQMVYPLHAPNGIALSPDGKRLYVALTYERKVIYFDVPEPGVIAPNTVSGPGKGTLDGSYLLTADFIGQSILDSMAVDTEGNLYVATMLPQGNNPMTNGGISIVSPDGDVDFVEINLPNNQYAPLPSNICFGGDDMKTAFITCGASGHLISMNASIPGLTLSGEGSNFDSSRFKKKA